MSTISKTGLSQENLHPNIHWNYFPNTPNNRGLPEIHKQMLSRKESVFCSQLTGGGSVDFLLLRVSGKRIDWWEDYETEREQEHLVDRARKQPWNQTAKCTETNDLGTSAEKGKHTMTQVLVVLVFMVDNFTTACSFLSWSINDLHEQEATWGVTGDQYLVNVPESEKAFFLHVLFLKQLDFLLKFQIVRRTDSNPVNENDAWALEFDLQNSWKSI